MNYDIDTPEGMDNAVEWTLRQLALLKDGGTWYVPRSGTLVTIDRKANVATLTGPEPELAIERVLLACGWVVVNKDRASVVCS